METIRRASIRICTLALLLAIAMLSACQPATQPPKDLVLEVTYSGVKGYGDVSAEDMDSFQYRFYEGATEHLFRIDNTVTDPVTGEGYALQNLLRCHLLRHSKIEV